MAAYDYINAFFRLALPFWAVEDDEFDDPENLSPADRVRRLQKDSKQRSTDKEKRPANRPE